jgi:hypothetical protein
MAPLIWDHSGKYSQVYGLLPLLEYTGKLYATVHDGLCPFISFALLRAQQKFTAFAEILLCVNPAAQLSDGAIRHENQVTWIENGYSFSC